MVLEMRPIFVQKILYDINLVLGEGIRVESRNLLFSPFLCLWLGYGSSLVMCPIFVSKLLNNTKLEIGWNLEICYLGLHWSLWLRYGRGFGNAPYICKKTI